MTIVESGMSLDTSPRPPFGVGALFGRAMRLFAKAFWPLAGLGFAYFALIQIGTIALAQWMIGQGIEPIGATAGGPTPIQIVSALLGGLAILVVASVFSGMVFTVALRREAGAEARLGSAVGNGFRYMLPMFLCIVAVSFLIGLGFAALVVPGLWLIGVYGIAPVVMIGDGRARGVFGRTRRLTKDYRWPVVGFSVLLYLVVMVLGFAGGFVIGFLGSVAPVAPGDWQAQLLRSLLIEAPVNALTTSLLIAGSTVIYRRLVEIKEGERGDALRTVFE